MVAITFTVVNVGVPAVELTAANRYELMGKLLVVKEAVEVPVIPHAMDERMMLPERIEEVAVDVS